MEDITILQANLDYYIDNPELLGEALGGIDDDFLHPPLWDRPEFGLRVITPRELGKKKLRNGQQWRFGGDCLKKREKGAWAFRLRDYYGNITWTEAIQGCITAYDTNYVALVKGFEVKPIGDCTDPDTEMVLADCEVVAYILKE